MWKVLVKKEFTGIFRSYFVNSKTGKARSKGSIALFFVLFAVLILILCGVFFALAYQLKALLTMDLVWLYYALMGILSVALGLFGSVFNTYVSLYLPKDNDLLLSLPIPPTTILLARMTLVFGLSLLYSGAVWLPTIIFGWISGQSGVLSFTAEGWDCEELAARLAQRKICVRAGLHCAPTAHESAGTIKTGTVRMSFSPFVRESDVLRAAAVIKNTVSP